MQVGKTRRWQYYLVAASGGWVVCAPVQSAHAQCPAGYGDVDGDGGVDVADAQCAALAIAAGLTAASPPECLASSESEADVTHDGVLASSDLATLVALALGLPLPSVIDANSNGCWDAFEMSCGDGVCADSLGEACFNCAPDCGSCPASCCQPHATAGCSEPVVEACVCGISEFCCGVLWDSTCVSLALEFCAPNCGGAGCAVEAPIACGQTVSGTTFGGPSILNSYACDAVPAEGAERVFAFTPPEDTTVDFTLQTPGGSALSLRGLSTGCSGESCVDSSLELVTLSVPAGETVHLAVDGPAGSEGAFAVTATCSSDCTAAMACGDVECGQGVCAGQVFACGSCPEGGFCSGGVCADESELPAGCPGGGSCFLGGDTPGCSAPGCCAAVCKTEPLCCTGAWINLCVALANDEAACAYVETVCGDGYCEVDEEVTCPTDCPPGYCGDGLCEGEETVESCPIDCDSLFGDCGDGICALIEPFICPGDCLAIGLCPGEGACTEPNGTPGCDEPACCDDICTIFPNCCTLAWDDICANFAESICP